MVKFKSDFGSYNGPNNPSWTPPIKKGHDKWQQQLTAMVNGFDSHPNQYGEIKWVSTLQVPVNEHYPSGLSPMCSKRPVPVQNYVNQSYSSNNQIFQTKAPIDPVPQNNPQEQCNLYIPSQTPKYEGATGLSSGTFEGTYEQKLVNDLQEMKRQIQNIQQKMHATQSALEFCRRSGFGGKQIKNPMRGGHKRKR